MKFSFHLCSTLALASIASAACSTAEPPDQVMAALCKWLTLTNRLTHEVPHHIGYH